MRQKHIIEIKVNYHSKHSKNLMDGRLYWHFPLIDMEWANEMPSVQKYCSNIHRYAN